MRGGIYRDGTVAHDVIPVLLLLSLQWYPGLPDCVVEQWLPLQICTCCNVTIFPIIRTHCFVPSSEAQA